VNFLKKARVFGPDRFFQFSLMFASKAGVWLSEALHSMVGSFPYLHILV